MSTRTSILRSVLLVSALAGASPALAQQVVAPQTPAEVTKPSNDVIMQPGYAAAVARWPTSGAGRW